MGFARRRALTVVADGANNQTPWISLKRGGMAIITGTLTGAITLQRRDAAGVVSDVTDNTGTPEPITVIGTYTITPAETQGDYRLNAKEGAVSAFPFTMALEGR